MIVTRPVLVYLGCVSHIVRLETTFLIIFSLPYHWLPKICLINPSGRFMARAMPPNFLRVRRQCRYRQVCILRNLAVKLKVTF